MSMPIHQEVIFKASRKRIYEVLSDTRQSSAMTGGAPADISREAGGSFSCFGGMISGRQIELMPNERIVQAWRVGNWPAGVYSIVKVELKEEGQQTRLILDHDAYPDGSRDHLDAGWKANYWEPLAKHLV